MRNWQLIVLCFFVFFAGEVAVGCSCLSPSTERALQIADIVFRGELVEHRFGHAVFRVDEQWKGNLGHYVNVDWRRGDRGDCDGFWPDDLKVSNELLVFATRSQSGTYKTSICFPTMSVRKAKERLLELGPGKPPLEANETPKMILWISFVCITVAGVLGILVYRRLRSRSPKTAS